MYVRKALSFVRKMQRHLSASRTYFLDKMPEKVNRRMLLDEERERMRR